jgi:monovalent cation:H+ antiporter-2, CPA2 family
LPPAAPLLEIGAVLLLAAGVGVLAARAGLSPVPITLLAGVLLGSAGPLARNLVPPPSVLTLGLELAVVVLLFAVGLDHGAGDRVAAGAGAGVRLAVVDAVVNALPGAAAGLLLGHGLRGAALLGGMTWVSSWSAVGGLLDRRGRHGNRETPAVLAVLVLEHAALAAYLPLAAALLDPGGARGVIAALLAALAALVAAGWLVVHWAAPVRRAVFAIDLPPALTAAGLAGLALAAAGLSARARIPAAGAAFLAGAVLAGPEGDRARPAIDVLRDLSLAAVCLFAGVAAGRGGGLTGAALAGVAVGTVASATKLATGWWAAGGLGVGRAGRRRAGTALVPRGEASVALAAVAGAAGLHRLAATGLAVVVVTGLVAAALDRAGAPVGAAPTEAPDPSLGP